MSSRQCVQFIDKGNKNAEQNGGNDGVFTTSLIFPSSFAMTKQAETRSP